MESATTGIIVQHEQTDMLKAALTEQIPPHFSRTSRSYASRGNGRMPALRAHKNAERSSPLQTREKRSRPSSSPRVPTLLHGNATQDALRANPIVPVSRAVCFRASPRERMRVMEKAPGTDGTVMDRLVYDT